MRGPKNAEPVVKLLAEHKAEVLAALVNTTLYSELLSPTPWFKLIVPPVKESPTLRVPALPGAVALKSCRMACSYTSVLSVVLGGPLAVASVSVLAGRAGCTAPSIGHDESRDEPPRDHTQWFLAPKDGCRTRGGLLRRVYG